jgi:DNA polymerase-3 subunit gamma/tau
MAYQVIARKYRPMTFDEVIGQSHVTSTLKNALATNRVAHAYLFSGTRGCGKTTTARILARALNCESPVNQNPDNTCAMCVEILEGRSLDVIEIDGASNRGVEEIRNLRDSVRYMPTHGKYKVYIIDEVHMLTKEAFNALLKTLEEPPGHVVFIFATTEVHKVPMTILSRCQRFDFRRIAIAEIVANLKSISELEHISVEDDALQIIAKRADGSLRDAQSIFEQVRSFCGDTITAQELLNAFHVVDQDIYFQLIEVMKEKNASEVLRIIDEMLKAGYDIREFVEGFIEHVRNLLIARTTNSSTLLEVPESIAERYHAEAKKFNEIDLLRYLKHLTELEQALRWAAQPRYRLEATVLMMVNMESSIELKELLDQLDELKKKIDTVPNGKVTASDDILEHHPSTSSAGLGGTSFENTYRRSVEKQTQKTENRVAHLQESTVSYSGAPLQSITIEEVFRQWNTFVEGVSHERIALGISLGNATPCDIKDGIVRISCSDDFQFNSLKREKTYLNETIQRIVGKRVAIEPILQKNIPLQQKKSEVSASIGVIKEKDEVEHPIIQILLRDFGAERIE